VCVFASRVSGDLTNLPHAVGIQVSRVGTSELKAESRPRVLLCKINGCLIFLLFGFHVF
jgi:hypothetical protein